MKFNSNNHISTAGQYLRAYENERYSFFERNFQFLNSILVPSGAEDFADVSFYQAGMDWDVYATKARAVILRIGQNIWPDIEFERNYAEAKKRGIAVGGYFFFDGRATPQQQANVIFNAMQNKMFELELFIDWEKNYGGLSEGLPNVVKLVQLVEAAGVRCKAVGIYTGYYYFIGNSNPTTHAAQYAYLKTRPLWLAWYASAALVKVPSPWNDWTHWQYGTLTDKWGQPTAELDRNRHNGTRAEFEALYLGGVVTPPTGETMKFEILQALNMRTAPLTGAIILPLPTGSFVWGVRDAATNWIHISKYAKPGEAEVALNAWCSGGSLYVKEVVEPAPADTLDINVDVIVNVEGYAPKTISISGSLEKI